MKGTYPSDYNLELARNLYRDWGGPPVWKQKWPQTVDGLIFAIAEAIEAAEQRGLSSKK